MTCSNIYDLKKIPIYYEELRGKKLFTKALSEIDVNKKSVHLFYYKNANIPICALPKLGVVIISKRGFLSFCYNFYFFINSFENPCPLIDIHLFILVDKTATYCALFPPFE